jgi:hypothetical protein
MALLERAAAFVHPDPVGNDRRRGHDHPSG